MSNELNLESNTTLPNDQTDSAARPLAPLDTEPTAISTEPLPSRAFDRDFDTNIEEATAPATTPADAQPTQVGTESEITPRNEFDRDFDTDIESTEPSPEDTPAEPVLPTSIRIDLSFIDPLGKGIQGLPYNIKVGDTPHEGVTDAQGTASLDGVEPLQDLEILIKKDNDTWTSKYKGQTACSDMTICAKSPHIKLSVSTEEHKGEAQKPTPPKPAAPKPAEVKPPLPRAGEMPKAAAPPAAPQATTARNEKGHPVSTFDAVKDWAGRNLVPAWLNNWLYKDYKDARKQEDAKNGADKANKATAKPSGAAPAQTSAPSAAKSSSLPAPATTGITSLDQKPPKAVTELIAIMEEQVKWDWTTIFRRGSGGISAQLASGELKISDIVLKNADKSNGYCYMSVRFGLKRAALVKDFEKARGSGSEGGIWLPTQGFIDITKNLPDPRWAAPGDVIVYKWTKEGHARRQAKKDLPIKQLNEKDLKQWEAAHAAWEKQVAALKEKGSTQLPKEPVKPTPRPLPPIKNDGHIDVRSYDGYLSDFKRTTFPSSTDYELIGVYRKIYDPLPDIRVRAFLKVLREWEHHGEHEDKDRYFKLNYTYSRPLKSFTDTSQHPFEQINDRRDTAAGAYQIKLNTYMGFLRPEYGIEKGFSPIQQDRIAVALIEEVEQGKILALIREGKIKEAVNKLVSKWSSLPSGVDPRKNKAGNVVKMDQLLETHRNFMEEILRRKS